MLLDGSRRRPHCCAQVGMEVTDCWYDLCLVKLCLVVLSNIWEISFPIPHTQCSSLQKQAFRHTGRPGQAFSQGLSKYA